MTADFTRQAVPRINYRHPPNFHIYLPNPHSEFFLKFVLDPPPILIQLFVPTLQRAILYGLVIHPFPSVNDAFSHHQPYQPGIGSFGAYFLVFVLVAVAVSHYANTYRKPFATANIYIQHLLLRRYFHRYRVPRQNSSSAPMK